MKNRTVLQDWVCELTFMQQSVLIASVRGPDSIRKDHVAKLLLRWLRRCTMLSAFERGVLTNPCDGRGGSFTGPSIASISQDWSEEERIPYYEAKLDEVLTDYFRTVDELPHHFQLHFMHASEILGYKHPVAWIRAWWLSTYHRLVNDTHLFPESLEQMDKRLGDYEEDWRAREEVTATHP